VEQLRAYLANFGFIDKNILNALLDLFEEKQFQKKEYLAVYGETANRIGFVKSGVLRAFFQKKSGEQYNKTFFTENDFVGAYSSLVTRQKNLIDIQCLTDCTILLADYPSFVALFDQFPKIERIARILAEQYFVQKEKREIELVTLNAKERYQIFQAEHPNLDQRIPQYYIASYLGITPTQLSRIRAKK